MLKQLATKFGQDAPLTTSRGKSIGLFRYENRLLEIGKVTFAMEDLIKKFLMMCPLTWKALQRHQLHVIFLILMTEQSNFQKRKHNYFITSWQNYYICVG